MKLFSILFSLVAFSSVTFADTPPATKEELAKWMAFFDKIVDTVVADKADCGKMAGDLNSLMDANKDLMEKAKAHQGEEMPKDVKDHVMAGVKKMGAALQEKCMGDKAVQAAMDRMGKGHHKQH